MRHPDQAAGLAGKVVAAVNQLRADGFDVRDEDVARLSPLKHANFNVLGSLARLERVVGVCSGVVAKRRGRATTPELPS